jgi:hypothetical protein
VDVAFPGQPLDDEAGLAEGQSGRLGDRAHGREAVAALEAPEGDFLLEEGAEGVFGGEDPVGLVAEGLEDVFQAVTLSVGMVLPVPPRASLPGTVFLGALAPFASVASSFMHQNPLSILLPSSAPPV